MSWLLGRKEEAAGVCIIDWDPQTGPTVVCDGVKEYARKVIDKEKVCIIEWDAKQHKPYVYCGPGKEVLFRILK